MRKNRGGMMEILYKAKSIKTGEWVEGYFFDDGMEKPEHFFVGRIVIEPYKGKACDEWSITGIDFEEVDPKTVCIYIGKDDISGKKIFSNDRIQFDDVGEEGFEYIEGYDFINEATFTWSNGRFELKDFTDTNSGVLDDMNGDHEFFMEVFENCKVIGNIFDNPKILEV